MFQVRFIDRKKKRKQKKQHKKGKKYYKKGSAETILNSYFYF